MKTDSSLLSKEKLEDIQDYFSVIGGNTPIKKVYKIHIKGVGCNARCPMCDDWKIKNNNLTKLKSALHETFQIIQKERVEKKMIYIFGGEPLLIFNDLLSIIQEGTKKNIEFDFVSNASLLNQEKINLLINAGLNRFNFSLDFPNTTHNKWRNLKSTFEKIIYFTNYIQQKKIPVKWNTVVGSFNIMQIDRFQKLYEYSFPNIHDFICIEDNGGKSKEYFLSTFQKEQINDTLDELSNKNPKIKIIKQGFSQKEGTGTKGNICYVPMRNIHYHISNNGLVGISPCHLDYKKITDHQIFTKQALTKGCNKCNSSCKDAINNYMSEVIKQYKLMSK